MTRNGQSGSADRARGLARSATEGPTEAGREAFDVLVIDFDLGDATGTTLINAYGGDATDIAELVATVTALRTPRPEDCA